MRKSFFVPLFILALNTTAACSEDQADKISGPYLGQDPPGETAELFAPGIISTGLHDDAGLAFTRDGKEILFRVAGNPYGIVGTMKEEGGTWSAPELASFSGHYPDDFFDFSGDGNRIVYNSERPLSGDGPSNDNSNLWLVNRTGDGWSKPQLLSSTINTEEFDEYMGSIADDDTLYFTRRTMTENSVSFETFMSKFHDGQYQEPERIHFPSEANYMVIANAVSPDQSYMVMSIRGHPDGYGREDLFVSFKNQDENWAEPVNLGPEINSDDTDWMPRVSRDGKYLFFVSWRYGKESWSSEDRTFDEFIALKKGPIYGWGADIYWASTDVIENLRPNDNSAQ